MSRLRSEIAKGVKNTMPIDSSPSTVATTALQGIPFSNLIGAPLGAAIEAQAKAAKSTVDFIQGVGLTGSKGNRRPVELEFAYYVGGRETRLRVPLLTVVPIPYIAIDSIDIRFKATINASSSSYQENTSSSTDKTEKETDVKAGAGWGWLPWSAKADYKASYSSKKDSRATQESKYSVEYTMDVAVHAGQEDLPAGMAKVLGLLEQSIAPKTSELRIIIVKSLEKISEGGENKIEVELIDNYGNLLKDSEHNFNLLDRSEGIESKIITIDNKKITSDESTGVATIPLNYDKSKNENSLNTIELVLTADNNSERILPPIALS